MDENLYEIWDERHCIASNMNLENACIFIHGYMEKFFAEPDIKLEIRRMSDNGTF